MTARLAAAALVCLVALPTLGGDLDNLQREFKGAIEKVTPATVACTVPGSESPGSSGVIVSRRGLVLSDGDAGMIIKRGTDDKPIQTRLDAVEIRVPDLKNGTYKAYRGKVLKRDVDCDTSLIRIEDPPAIGFAGYLLPGRSDPLRVGDLAFAMGNAFGLSSEQPPTLTSGIVSSLTYLPAGDAGGRLAHLFTSAAVNPGMNGGPVVDVNGRLVGTISTWGRATDPTDPYQFLGKVIPIDRLRAAYTGIEEFDEVFGNREPPERRTTASDALATVLHHTAAAAYASVVSIEVKRPNPVDAAAPGQGEMMKVPRYGGPFTGVVVSREGHVVSSLYNLTNTLELAFPEFVGRMPPESKLSTGLAEIEGVTVYFPTGGSAPATVTAYDEHLGIALLKAQVPQLLGGSTSAAVDPIPPADQASLRPGTFTLCLGNPFGAQRNPDPLLTFGILSKVHAPDAPPAWRGQWQTDAAVTDANCGGAVVGIDGRLIGILNIWAPTRHGRSSGIGFVVPWPALETSLAEMLKGSSVRRAFLGITWGEDPAEARIGSVLEGHPAAAAGMLADDVITRMDDTEIVGRDDCVAFLRTVRAGQKVRVEVDRGGAPKKLDLVLGARP